MRIKTKTFWGYDFPKLDAKVNEFLNYITWDNYIDIKYTSFVTKDETVEPSPSYEYLTATVIYKEG